MYCPTCGAELKFEDAEICPKCGVRIKEPPTPTSPKFVKQKLNEHPCFVGCSSMLVGLFILLAIVLLLGAFISASHDPVFATICGFGGVVLLVISVFAMKRNTDTQK